MKNLIPFMLLLVLPLLLQANPGESVSNPIIITDVVELQAMKDGLNKHYRLANNIDASGESFEPIGDYNTPFTGSLQGGGNVIAGLSVVRLADDPDNDYIGLFGYVDGATIDSVGLTNGSMQGLNYVGGLVGYSNNSHIRDCFTNISVSGHRFLGGVAGVSSSESGGSIIRCHAMREVTGYDVMAGGSHLQLADYCGGLVGMLYQSTVHQCYTVSSVDASGTSTGGLVGTNSSSSITNSYWNSDSTAKGVGTGTGGSSLTTAQMFQQSSFSGWDFTNVWTIDEGVSFPRFTWRMFCTLTFIAGENGTVNNGLQNILAGENGLSVTATADQGYHFVKWSDNETTNPRNNKYVVSDLTVTAQFALDTFNLSYIPGDNGTLSGNLTQSVTYGSDGSSVTAIPNENYVFVQWSDGVSDNPRTDLNVSSSHSVTALFSLNSFTVSYVAGVNGSISGEKIQTLPYGATTTTVTAIADDGYTFDMWSDGLTNATRSDLVPNTDTAFTAEFRYLFTGGDGSVDSPYQIRTVEDLQAMALNLSANYELVNDIDGSDTRNWNVGDHDDDPQTPDSAAGFKPIGKSDYDFTGSFTGNGYVISNLYINLPNSYYVGLFGAIDTATICSLGVVNINFTGNYHVGGLTGRCSYLSDISNCYTTGVVNGNYSVGGVVGSNYNSIISNCYAAGTVSGNDNVGGVVGYSSSSTLNCYATGVVSGINSVGGVAGYNSSSAIVSNCFWDSTTTGIADGIGTDQNSQTVLAKTTGELKQENTFTEAGWDFSVIWEISEGNSYPWLKFNTTADFTITYTSGIKGMISGDTIQTVTKGGNTTAVSVVPNSGYVFTGWSDGRTDNPRITYNIASDLNISAEFIAMGGGSGIEGDPFIIKTVTHLQNIQHYPEAYYRLANDIDAGITNPSHPDFALGGFSVMGFKPIGDYLKPFTGSINGGGFTISNLFINRPTAEYVGLFSVSGNAFIDSLKIVDNNFLGKGMVGGIVGRDKNTTIIKNCSVTGVVSGENNVGGIVGYTSHSCTVSYCYTAGEINGNDYVGGVVGFNSSVVTNSYSTGMVNGNKYVGGIAGANNSGEVIKSCFTGEVNGDDCVGGIAGFNSSRVSNSYAAGGVNGNDNIGGVVGYNGSWSTVSDCFWNSTTTGVFVGIGIDENSQFVPAKTAAELKTETTYTDAGWNFNDTWLIDEGDDYPRHIWSVKKLTYSAGDNGTVDDTVQYVLIGRDGTAVTAIAEGEGYRFKEWDDGVKENPRIDRTVASDITVSALFSNIYTVTYTAGSNGSITGTGSQTLPYGVTTAEVTAVPAAGYNFVSWSDGSVNAARTDVVPATDTAFAATFAWIPVITIVPREDSVMTLKNRDTLVTAELMGEVSKEDTLLITTVIDTVIDSIWSITDTLKDGVVTGTEVLFVRDSIWIDIISTDTVINEYQDPVLITSVSEIKSKIKGIVVGPNPVSLSESGVNILIGGGRAGSTVRIVVFDNLGNIIDEQTGKTLLNKSCRFIWDLQNSKGQKVAVGSYSVVAIITHSDGSVDKVFKFVGVKK